MEYYKDYIKTKKTVFEVRTNLKAKHWRFFN